MLKMSSWLVFLLNQSRSSSRSFSLTGCSLSACAEKCMQRFLGHGYHEKISCLIQIFVKRLNSLTIPFYFSFKYYTSLDNVETHTIVLNNLIGHKSFNS